MHLTETRTRHERGGWTVDFIGEDGVAVSVHVDDRNNPAEADAIARAREIMVELTAFGTRGGGRSVNPYDAESNGNFDDAEPLLDTRH